MDVLKEIRKYRKKINQSIKKHGLNSSETMEMSEKLNELINRYYEENKTLEYPEYSDMKEFYDDSYIALKMLTLKNNKFPTVEEWNRLAKEKGHLSNKSLEYITQCDWNYLQIRVEKELKIEIF